MDEMAECSIGPAFETMIIVVNDLIGQRHFIAK
jgi:hypothetical protein